MMNFFYIVTPCSRADNLKILHNSIITTFGSDFLWFILGDLSKSNIDQSILSCPKTQIIQTENSTFGNNQRNTGVEKIKLQNKKDYWVHFLDDDNILHPELNKHFDLFSPDFDVAVVSQCLKTGHPRRIQFEDYKNMEASKENMKVGKVDMAQIFFRSSCIDDVHFKEKVYNADGVLAEQLYKKNYKFNFIKDYLCYYNYLSNHIIY